ncbi:glycosyltransferase [Meridianimarinicoccus sp. MJW13]|uniref:glycosyltransferase n=1 Tax=Meridianimarinicoccus sp. MJW13 TaxID=2720031 RepID=UPI00186819A4|nr:glycosyltransferase [Fluviibacterium sp. MJW13]
MERCRRIVEGVAPGAEVALVCKSTRAEARADLGTMSADGRFVLDLPVGHSTPWLVLKVDGERHEYPLPPISRTRRMWSRVAVLPRFLVTTARLVPDGIRWRFTQDLEARERIKRRLGFAQQAVWTDLDPRFLEPASDEADAPDPTPITLILPVHNAFDLLSPVLDRIQRHTDLQWRMILIEDASTDDRVRPLLRDWAAEMNQIEQGRVELIEQDENRGFVGSVNLAFSRAVEIGQDVVLLNSDCFLPDAWASRLLSPLRAQRHVATVTPMANDAELLSVPMLARRGPLAEGAVDRIDAAARLADLPPSLTPLPTGVGFCMAIDIDYLLKVPAYDTAFGTGYGEEVDWCQKIRALGGFHCAHPGVFVEHRGAASFGTEQKAARIRKNDRLIAQRYPEFARQVQRFVSDDPLLTERLFLACAWIGAHGDTPVPVFLAHSLGGGADAMVQARIKARTRAGLGAVVLRVGGVQRWQLEAHTPQGVTKGATGDFAMIEKLLSGVTTRHVIYSCGVGDPWAHELPRHLACLRRRPSDLLEIEVHDFFPISPSQTLLDGQGFYNGVPHPPDAGSAHVFRGRRGLRVSLETWQETWQGVMRAASRVTVFSHSSFDIMAEVFPKTVDRMVVQPHPLKNLPPVLPRPDPAAAPVIGVLGHIRKHKGAALLRDMSQLLARGGQARVVVLGTVEPSFRLARSATIHGAYRTSDIPALVRRYGITCWMIPSIWPETFSFVTHEALATGLPVFAYDLGGQGDALRAAPNGHPLPFVPGGDAMTFAAGLEQAGVIGAAQERVPMLRRAGLAAQT